MIRLLTLSGLLLCGTSWADAKPNRETLIEAAFRATPFLLKYVEQLKSFDKLLPDSRDRETFRQVLAIAARGQVKLEFSDDRESFRLNEGEPERLMRSTAIQDGESGENLDDGKIIVNRQLLNSLAGPLELSNVLKLLFHEFAHKTSELNWGVRDRLAQVYDNQITPHIMLRNVNENADLIVLSLPAAKIDKQIGPSPTNRPLPSNLVLVRLSDGYVDLTDNLHERTSSTTALLRSMWTEANRVIYGIMRGMMQALTQAMKPVFEGFFKPFIKSFGGDPSNLDEPFARLENVDVKEIRTLEIHDAKASAVEDGLFVSMRATYTIGRTDKAEMPIQVTGFPWRDSFPVPVMIHMVVPERDPESAQIDVQMRPNADYMTTARASGLIRQGGLVSSLKVRFASESAEPIERVGLIVHFGMGHLTLDSMRIDRLDNGQIEALFEVPPSFCPPDVAMIADAILINGDRTVFLERLLTLSRDDGGLGFVPRKEVTNEFVSGSVGLWGLQDGKPTFRNHFQFKEPVWIIDNVKSSNFSLNHSALKVEFQLRREQRIREIRLYLNRSLIAVDTTPDEGKESPQTISAEIGGHTYRFANGGKMKGQKDVSDITSIDASEIYSAYLPDGNQKVQAVLAVPFRMIEGASGPSDAHAPPMGYPFLLEVVTDSLQTLRYYFQDPNATQSDAPDCEDFLQEIFRNATPKS